MKYASSELQPQHIYISPNKSLLSTSHNRKDEIGYNKKHAYERIFKQGFSLNYGRKIHSLKEVVTRKINVIEENHPIKL